MEGARWLEMDTQNLLLKYVGLLPEGMEAVSGHLEGESFPEEGVVVLWNWEIGLCKCKLESRKWE